MSLKLKVVLGVLVFVTLFFVSRVVTYFGRGATTASMYSSSNTAGSGIVAQFSNVKDSDHDGIPDAQESQYGSDPFNADTDSDGFLDGEEAMTGYDPANKDSNPDQQGGPQTVTQSFIEKLVGGYLSGDLDFQKTGTTTYAQNMDILTYATIDASGKSTAPSYIPDPIIADSSSPEVTKKYLIDVSRLLNIIPSDDKYYMGSFDESSQLMTNQSVKDQYMLALVLDRVGTKLASVPVPHEMLAWHNQMVRNLADMAQLYYSLANANQDPIKAFTNIGASEATITSFVTLGATFNGYLTTHGLTTRVRAFANLQEP